MAIRKPTAGKLPRKLLERACEIADRNRGDGEDYKDVAARWCRAFEEAESELGMDGLLRMLGMPDGVNCPRAFDAWYERVRPSKPFRRRAKDWLRGLVTQEPSKWTDPYVQELAALDHAGELLALHRRRAELKAEGDRRRAEAVGSSLDSEMADLWCILSMRRMRSPAFAGLCAERAWRFRP